MAVYIAGVNQPVDTGNTYFREIVKNQIAASMGAEHKLSERARISGREIYGGGALEARVEYARWIVDCPNCRNAEFAFEDKLFYCSVCGNADMSGKIRRVKMPAQRQEIEVILGQRPIVNRHWYPGETVAQLQDENKLGVN